MHKALMWIGWGGVAVLLLFLAGYNFLNLPVATLTPFLIGILLVVFTYMGVHYHHMRHS